MLKRKTNNALKLSLLFSFTTIVMPFIIPFYFVPDFKYSNKIYNFFLFDMFSKIDYITTNILGDNSTRFYYNQSLYTNIKIAITVFFILSFIGLIIFNILIFVNGKKYVRLSRYVLVFVIIYSMLSIFLNYIINTDINTALGIDNNFLNLTINSKMQPTYAPFLQIILSLVQFVIVKNKVFENDDNKLRSIRKNHKKYQVFSKKTKLSFTAIIVLIPIVILFGVFVLKDRNFYFISLCIIVLIMIPFFSMFEKNSSKTREIVIISVLVVISVAGRTAFAMLPNFKPVTAIIIIAGIGLGASAGFLTGAMSAFVSNFFFGHGPWTPWQMFALGMIGFLSGLIFMNDRKKYADDKIILSCFGFIMAFAFYGFILDTSSVFSYLENITFSSIMAKYISGVPVNISHGISTILFLYLFSKPLIKKIERVKIKYGIL